MPPEAVRGHRPFRLRSRTHIVVLEDDDAIIPATAASSPEERGTAGRREERGAHQSNSLTRAAARHEATARRS